MSLLPMSNSHEWEAAGAYFEFFEAQYAVVVHVRVFEALCGRRLGHRARRNAMHLECRSVLHGAEHAREVVGELRLVNV